MLYRYEAVAASGAVIFGEMEAASARAVVDHLQALGHLPVRAEPTGDRRAGWLHRDLFARRVSGSVLAAVTRELATLLQADLPLDRALEILIGLAEGERVATLLRGLLDRVRGGGALADAMADQPAVFPRYYVSMVRAGEASGALGPAMMRLSAYLERVQALRESVRSALIYPAVLLVIVGLSIVILLTVVLPEFKPLFDESGRQLPLFTRVVVGAGEFAGQHGWIVALCLALLALLLKRQRAKPAFRRTWDRGVLRIPYLGGVIARFETARLARTLGVLLKSGVPLPAALGLLQDTVGNAAMAAALDHVAAQLKQGHGFAEPLARTGLFPPLAVHLARIGEETGRPDEMLLKAGDIYDAEVQRAIDRLMALLVPALTITLGLIVGAIVAAVLMAVLSINELAL